MRQALTRRRPRATGGERADVHFVDDLAVTRRRTAPRAGRPFECPRIDHHGWSKRTVWLKARDGIGAKPPLEAKPIPLTSADIGQCGAEIAAFRCRHGDVFSSLQRERNLSLCRRPHGEGDAVGTDCGTERWMRFGTGLTMCHATSQ